MPKTDPIVTDITFKDEATPTLKKVNGELSRFSKSGTADIKKVETSFGLLSEASLAMKVAVVAAVATVGYKIKQFFSASVKESVKLENALIGLSTIAKAFGQDVDATTQAVKDLTNDGLLPMADASTALKNLLQAGFGLEQSIELIKGFKDAAAFGRQSALSFGEAITSATEGIKNQNSILVDNAGVTKNISVILKEAGYSMQDLSDKTKGANARLALYNGLLGEMAPMQGDAARLTETFSGKLAELDFKLTLIKQTVGDELTPELAKLIDEIKNNSEAIADFAGAAGTTAVVALRLLNGVLKTTDTLLNHLTARIRATAAGWKMFLDTGSIIEADNAYKSMYEAVITNLDDVNPKLEENNKLQKESVKIIEKQTEVRIKNKQATEEETKAQKEQNAVLAEQAAILSQLQSFGEALTARGGRSGRAAIAAGAAGYVVTGSIEYDGVTYGEGESFGGGNEE